MQDNKSTQQTDGEIKMTSIGIVSRSARTPYQCNECDVDIRPNDPYLRVNRCGSVLKIHLYCSIPLIQHRWIWNMRLPDGETLDYRTLPERWEELIATT